MTGTKVGKIGPNCRIATAALKRRLDGSGRGWAEGRAAGPDRAAGRVEKGQYQALRPHLSLIRSLDRRGRWNPGRCGLRDPHRRQELDARRFDRPSRRHPILVTLSRDARLVVSRRCQARGAIVNTRVEIRRHRLKDAANTTADWNRPGASSKLRPFTLSLLGSYTSGVAIRSRGVGEGRLRREPVVRSPDRRHQQSGAPLLARKSRDAWPRGRWWRYRDRSRTWRVPQWSGRGREPPIDSHLAVVFDTPGDGLAVTVSERQPRGGRIGRTEDHRRDVPRGPWARALRDRGRRRVAVSGNVAYVAAGREAVILGVTIPPHRCCSRPSIWADISARWWCRGRAAWRGDRGW